MVHNQNHIHPLTNSFDYTTTLWTFLHNGQEQIIQLHVERTAQSFMVFEEVKQARGTELKSALSADQLHDLGAVFETSMQYQRCCRCWTSFISRSLQGC